MIDLTYTDNIAVLRLAHGKVNALDLELCEEIVEVLLENSSSSSGALVITGHGGIFSAGVDLLRLLDGGPSYARAFIPALTRAIEAIFFHPKPVVVAVNGHAIAGGCVLACAGDRRLISRQTGRIGLTELLVGVPFPTVALEVMRFVISNPARLQEMVCSGATYAADMAAVLGLIDEVTHADLLLDRAIGIAQSLADLRADVFTLTKRQSREAAKASLRLAADLDATVAELGPRPRPPTGLATMLPAPSGQGANKTHRYAARPCSRSVMMSTTSSIPIDTRTTSGPAPACCFCASDSCRWVVEAG